VATDEAPDVDVSTVEAARTGDRAAFGLLYTRYLRLVHGILLSRVPRAEVDDLVHDVFLSAMGRLATLRDSRAFGPWLAAIARNRATDHLRRAPVIVELVEEPRTRAEGDRADAVAAMDAICSLPDAYRETLVLRLVEGMTGPEIAARTGLTPGSVRVNLHRGMKLLRERLEGPVR
jgi:RNA polymerase sigma-70 factor, ECF subfamily